MTHRRYPRNPRAIPARLGLSLALTTAACASQPQMGPAGAPSQAIVREGVAIEVLAESAADSALPAGTALELQDARVRLKLTDAATGEPLSGLRPVAWIDRRPALDFTSAEQCKQKVQMYLQGKLYPEGSIKAHADVDLNSFFVLTLNQGPSIAVIDPIMGFGKTKLRTSVLLEAQGADWVLSDDHQRLFVTMPSTGKVAVVDTDSWKVVRNVEAGDAPMRIAFSPDGERLWVTNEPEGAAGGVTVLDASSLEVLARIETGEGAHVLAFSGDGHHAFVANREAGTVSVIDGHELAKVADVPTGTRPVDLSFSASDGAVYVAHEGDGQVVAIDGHSLEILRRIQLEPGLRTLDFVPAPEQGHGGHGAHGAHGGAGVGPERYGFLTNPETGRVYVIDATNGQIVRADSVGNAPDQITFTASFAYVRSSKSSEISMIPLNQPVVGGVGSLDKFTGGQKAPLEAGPAGLASAIAASPDMHDAVFIMNPADRMIYYFHYMEGMPIPSGGLTTYGFQPRAVMVARKGMREEAPGEYSATIRLSDRGEYDFVLVLDEPRVVECIPSLSVRANPKLVEGRVALAVEALGAGREMHVGENRLRFRLRDDFTGKLLTGLEDVGIVISAPGMPQLRAQGRAVEEGVYEFAPTVPESAIYYVSFEIPSLDIFARSKPPVIFRAAGAVAEGAQDER